ncbi:hypothetical protein JCM11641_001484 [Rhodosporidiobolus odoratus]
MWRSLESRLDIASSTVSARYSLPQIVVTPSSASPPGTTACRPTPPFLLLQRPSYRNAAAQPPSRDEERVAVAPEHVSPPAKERLSLRAQRLRRRGSSLEALETLEIQPTLPFSALTRPGELSEVLLIQPTDLKEELPLLTAISSLRSDATTPTSAIPLFHLLTRDIVSATYNARLPHLCASLSSPRAVTIFPPRSDFLPFHLLIALELPLER